MLPQEIIGCLRAALDLNDDRAGTEWYEEASFLAELTEARAAIAPNEDLNCIYSFRVIRELNRAR